MYITFKLCNAIAIDRKENGHKQILNRPFTNKQLIGYLLRQNIFNKYSCHWTQYLNLNTCTFNMCSLNTTLAIIHHRIALINKKKLGYEPADLTVHPPPPPRTIKGGFSFSNRCLVPPKCFPQRKSGFCRRC